MKRAGLLLVLFASFTTIIILFPLITTALILSLASGFTLLSDKIFVVILFVLILFLTSSVFTSLKTIKMITEKQKFKDLKPLTKALLFLSVPLFVLIITGSYYQIWKIKLEKFCRKKVIRDFGKTTTLLDANPDEYAYVGKGGKIYLQFREQLKCQRNTPLFQRLD